MSAVVKYVGGEPWVNTSALREVMFGDHVPEIERFRRYWGPSITPLVIESVIRSAELGYTRDLTDLTYESMFLDPHYAACAGKRFRALGSVKPKVVDAIGDDLDPAIAAKIGAEVRQQVAYIPRLRHHMIQLTWAHCHGRAALEKQWREVRTKDGSTRWWIEALAWIHPRRLALGPDRELRIRDDLYGGAAFEPRGFDMRELPQKFITYTPQLFNDYPEREGFGPRGLYWAFFKRFSQRERMVLLEVFGKPWRIVYVDETTPTLVSKEQLDEAADTVDALGSNRSARVPRGVKVETDQPHPDAGQIHQTTIDHADDQISKLVLQSTRTMDAKPDGLGSEQSRVHQDGETLAIMADCWGVADVMTERISGDYVLMNYGPEFLRYTPTIELPYETPPDPDKEVDRTSKVFDMGIPLKEDEVYERIGFSRPETGDRVMRKAPPPAPPGFGAPPGGQPPQSPPPPGAAPPPAAREAGTPPAPGKSDGGDPPAEGPPGVQARMPSADVCCAAQPSSVHGSPDQIVTPGVTSAADVLGSWGERLAHAAGAAHAPTEADAEVARAAGKLPLEELARVFEQQMLHGWMLGMLDAQWERENDRLVKVERFDLRDPRAFARSGFDTAYQWFMSKEIVTSDAWKQLEGIAKMRAFSIAGDATDEMVRAVRDELGRQIASSKEEGGGPSLPDFRKFVAQHLEQAGWTPTNPSHVETIFRTNIMGAYASGRHAEATRPEVLRELPYWQIITVNDGPPRQRATHQAAHLVLLPASDAFWRRAYPPFGYNCRCRVVSRSKRWVDSTGAAIGPVPSGLPDRGFTSGTSGLPLAVSA